MNATVIGLIAVAVGAVISAVILKLKSKKDSDLTDDE